MSSFGFAVRSGIEKVAATPTSVMAPDFFRGDSHQLAMQVLDPESMFHRQRLLDPTRFLSGLDARAAEIEAQRRANMRNVVDRYGTVGAHQPHLLPAGARDELSIALARDRQLAEDYARLQATRRYADPAHSAVPEIRKGTTVGQLQAGVDRAMLERQIQHQQEQALHRHGGKELSELASRFGVGPAKLSPKAVDPQRAQLAANLSRGAELAGVTPAQASAGAQGAPSFFSKYKGPLVGGAALLGGGMLLSNMLGKKKREREQGPYGPVYR